MMIKNDIIAQVALSLGHLNGGKVILFGSYAKGTQSENSDIDLLVVTNDHFVFELASCHANDQNGELNGEINTGQQKNYTEIILNPGINASRIAETLKIPFNTIDKHINVLLKLRLIERRGSKKTGGY